MSDAAFSQDALQTHNQYRALHGAPQLRLNDSLHRSAQEWAERLVNKPKLENSPVSCRGEVGENISSRSSSGSVMVDITGKEVTDQWYKDISNYDFKSGQGNAGNFTQLVWSGTREVGFGKAQHNGRCVVVAHYKPPGNVRGHYTENVKQPDSSNKTTVTAPQGAAAAPPKSKKTKTTVVTETVTEPSGKTYTVKREIEQWEDDFGNVTERVREIRLDNKDPVPDGSHTAADSNQASGQLQPDDDSNGGGEKKELNNFILSVIETHNNYRHKHGAPALKRNKDLDVMAQEWAETLARSEKLSNSCYTFKGSRLGENIASRWSNGPCDYTGTEVTEHWYSEEQKFAYGKEPKNVQGIGNFTQLVWKNSKEVGVGKAIHSGQDGTKVIVVCHYFPAGNVLECFRENVGRPS